jgi:hypothetical protein
MMMRMYWELKNIKASGRYAIGVVGGSNYTSINNIR